VPNDGSIQEKGYSFVALDDINEKERVKIIDFIGVLMSVGSVSEI